MSHYQKFKVIICILALFTVNNVVMTATDYYEQQDTIRALQEENSETSGKLKECEKEIESLLSQNQELRDKITREHEESSRGGHSIGNFTVTAYDLSVDSCGKTPGEYGYGITSSGVSLEGHTLESARAIAVDPSVIPMGSSVRIKFEDESWSHLNGIYTAVDTGGAIIGNRIDLFMGEDAGDECEQFGVRQARVEIF